MVLPSHQHWCFHVHGYDILCAVGWMVASIPASPHPLHPVARHAVVAEAPPDPAQAGGSDFPNVFKVLGHCMANGGIFKIGRKGWWEAAKPSVIAAKGLPAETRYNDAFVDDVRRAMQATGMFFFFPVQYWNDNGLVPSAMWSLCVIAEY